MAAHLIDTIDNMDLMDYVNQEAEGEIAFGWLSQVVSEWLWLATNGIEASERAVEALTDQIICMRITT